MGWDRLLRGLGRNIRVAILAPTLILLGAFTVLDAFASGSAVEALGGIAGIAFAAVLLVLAYVAGGD